jgi:hypothetical protein
VGEFVGEYGAEEQDGGSDGQGEACGATEGLVRRGVLQEQAVGDQQGDHHPGDIDTDLDASDPSQTPGVTKHDHHLLRQY